MFRFTQFHTFRWRWLAASASEFITIRFAQIIRKFVQQAHSANIFVAVCLNFHSFFRLYRFQ
jgi:hypothetical protein